MTERRLKQALLKPALVLGFRNTHGNWRNVAAFSGNWRHLAAIGGISRLYTENHGFVVHFAAFGDRCIFDNKKHRKRVVLLGYASRKRITWRAGNDCESLKTHYE